MENWLMYGHDIHSSRCSDESTLSMWCENGLFSTPEALSDIDEPLNLQVFVALVHKEMIPYVLFISTTSAVHKRQIIGLPCYINNDPDDSITNLIGTKPGRAPRYLGTLWQTHRGSKLLSIKAPHCLMPYAKVEFYDVPLTETSTFDIPNNYSLKAIPLSQLESQGDALGIIPAYLSRFNFKYYVHD